MEKYPYFSVMTNLTVLKKDDFRAVNKGAFREYCPLGWIMPAFKDSGQHLP